MDDLIGIVVERFPQIDPQVVQKMVLFVQSLQDTVMEKRLFGQTGSPWEFNLRDVFRWSELMVVEKVEGGTGGKLQFCDVK